MQLTCIAYRSIASLLMNKGLVVERRRRVRTPVQNPPYAFPEQSNSVWCADYKGHFRTGDGTRIDPLTVTDAASRYLLRCQIVERTDFVHAQAVFGSGSGIRLSDVIHTDNGVPFASVAPGGMSRLSMWFVRLGITPERSRPGSPQDNGRHERMHRTLKQATAAPPQPTARLQQKAFDAFCHEFNRHRPHQALGDLTPAACYQTSSRAWPRRVPELQYADDLEVRRVSQQGSIRWKGQRTFISEVFRHDVETARRTLAPVITVPSRFRLVRRPLPFLPPIAARIQKQNLPMNETRYNRLAVMSFNLNNVLPMSLD